VPVTVIFVCACGAACTQAHANTTTTTVAIRAIRIASLSRKVRTDSTTVSPKRNEGRFDASPLRSTHPADPYLESNVVIAFSSCARREFEHVEAETTDTCGALPAVTIKKPPAVKDNRSDTLCWSLAVDLSGRLAKFCTVVLLCFCMSGGLSLGSLSLAFARDVRPRTESPAAEPQTPDDSQLSGAAPSPEKKPEEDTGQTAVKKDDKEMKHHRGALVVAPLPIVSPAIGSGIIPVAGYIFPFQEFETGISIFVTDTV
jgi:hypothetical protein